MHNLTPSTTTSSEYRIINSATYAIAKGSENTGGVEYYYDHDNFNICYDFNPNYNAVSNHGYISVSYRVKCGLPFAGYCTWEQRNYQRFHLTDVRQGTTITKAEMTVRQSTGNWRGDGYFYIYGEDVDEPTAPRAGKPIFDMPLTTNYTIWDAPWFDATNYYTSPDLTAVVQEVINRPGWQDYGYLTLVVKQPTGYDSRGWDGASAIYNVVPPSLYLEWVA